MTDPGIDDLLAGLEGQARTERAELLTWLLEQGIAPEEIRNTVAPMLLAMRRQIGDDGHYVSAREIAEQHGMDLALLQRVQRAIGLARVDDPDAAVFTRADAEAAAGLQRFVDLGLDPDDLVLASRVLADGLADAAEVMRHAALGAVLTPGATELETAQRSAALLEQAAPLLGPAVADLLLVQLRQLMETEAVTASERAAGTPLPGARSWGCGAWCWGGTCSATDGSARAARAQVAPAASGGLALVRTEQSTHKLSAILGPVHHSRRHISNRSVIIIRSPLNDEVTS